MIFFKKITIVGQESVESLHTAGKDVKLYSHFENVCQLLKS